MTQTLTTEDQAILLAEATSQVSGDRSGRKARLDLACTREGGRYSDLALSILVLREGGNGRAAGYLLTLPLVQRDAADTEAETLAGFTGVRYADAVRSIVSRFSIGDTRVPYTEYNQKMIAQEREQMRGRV